ncbi:hypothetical protein LINPERPRIM_LOCUS27764 [Linum perenne]
MKLWTTNTQVLWVGSRT